MKHLAVTRTVSPLLHDACSTGGRRCIFRATDQRYDAISCLLPALWRGRPLTTRDLRNRFACCKCQRFADLTELNSSEINTRVIERLSPDGGHHGQ